MQMLLQWQSAKYASLSAKYSSKESRYLASILREGEWRPGEAMDNVFTEEWSTQQNFHSCSYISFKTEEWEEEWLGIGSGYDVPTSLKLNVYNSNNKPLHQYKRQDNILRHLENSQIADIRTLLTKAQATSSRSSPISSPIKSSIYNSKKTYLHPEISTPDDIQTHIKRFHTSYSKPLRTIGLAGYGSNI